MDEITYTHKGWFGLCPVYISEPHTDEAMMEDRYPFTGWLVTVSIWLYAARHSALGMGEPAPTLRVTGELEDPFVVKYER